MNLDPGISVLSVWETALSDTNMTQSNSPTLNNVSSHYLKLKSPSHFLAPLNFFFTVIII